MFLLFHYELLFLLSACKHGGISKGCGNLKLFINFYHGITGYWVSHAISLFVLRHGHSLGICPKNLDIYRKTVGSVLDIESAV